MAYRTRETDETKTTDPRITRPREPQGARIIAQTYKNGAPDRSRTPNNNSLRRSRSPTKPHSRLAEKIHCFHQVKLFSVENQS
ncbi:hypothetical protein ISN45_Aa06g028630 [Arabidopsis thaliana x Arabidopsis arenosa]|uniref:Uncharacterized protein n=1 Tax=Arabidopsis thaliana x Arabidopsis arenosa TaxID=1240361 RepID=A0A8T1Z1H0_9BRAS|nr:hypothetical protein ISN45_Aa06g028630 [Arabidopsis thaliana x Arabidopsis arenosa]